MEFAIEKCTLLIMISRKREIEGEKNEDFSRQTTEIALEKTRTWFPKGKLKYKQNPF